MKPGPGMVAGKAVKATDAIIGGTIGKVAKGAQGLLLGELPDAAKDGSFQEDLSDASQKLKKKGRKRAWLKAKAGGIVRFVLRRPAPTTDDLAEVIEAAAAEQAAEEDEKLEELQYEALAESDLEELTKESGTHTGSTETLTRKQKVSA